jgi:hypothetical protein
MDLTLECKHCGWPLIKSGYWFITAARFRCEGCKLEVRISIQPKRFTGRDGMDFSCGSASAIINCGSSPCAPSAGRKAGRRRRRSRITILHTVAIGTGSAPAICSRFAKRAIKANGPSIAKGIAQTLGMTATRSTQRTRSIE